MASINCDKAYVNCAETCPDKINADRSDPTKADFSDCTICFKHIHLNCRGFPAGSSEKIKKFVCSDCKNADNQTLWMAEEPNRRKQNEKAREYFEVSEIIRHRPHRSYCEFKVRWNGYASRHDSCIRERDMDGAIDLLQDYCIEHHLELSEITAFVGSSSQEANPDAWISIYQAIRIYEDIVDLFKIPH